MKHWRAYLTGALLGIGAILVLPLTGLWPHHVGTGGWLVEGYRWMVTRQSVTLRTALMRPPNDLHDPARIARAAGAYELICRDCHGAPDLAPARFAADLMPKPPELAGALQWRPAARVFATIRDGVAHSAMPAWAAPERADEIWDMVAFLQHLPDMSGQTYADATGAARCSSCHDKNGVGIPRLDIQTAPYLAAALRSYRDGQRASGVMQPAAHGLSDTQIDTLSRYLGHRRQVEPLSQPLPQLVEKGDRARDIPSCLSCHNAQARVDYPRLLGQDADYLARQLDLFAEMGAARGGAQAHVMAPIAMRLTDTERQEIAKWFAAQPLSEPPPIPPPHPSSP